VLRNTQENLSPIMSPLGTSIFLLTLFLNICALYFLWDKPEGRVFDSRWCNWNFSM